MSLIRTALASLALAATAWLLAIPAGAQQQQQQRPPAQRPPATQPQQRPAQRPAAPAGQVPGPTEAGAPRLPPLDRAPPPPAAVIGVIGAQEVFEASVAVREVRQTLQRRLARLQEDSVREQQRWRDAQQALAAERGQLTPEQLREKERELQEQITNGQRILRERNAAIQAAGQKALAEVERVMLYVIRQVAEARGLTMVIQRQAIVLAVEEHDISEAVANQLNRALTSVPLDPDPAEASATTPPARRN
jgi:Skp family chaperone for outer membrane proteins